MDLHKMTSQLKPVKGQRLAKWLERFLVASPDQLDQWSGHFTEVVTAKAIAIYRRRGVIEEHEANNALFGRLVNSCYRVPAIGGSKKVAGNNTPQTFGDLLRAAAEE
jgi:hypothetical protein